MALTVEHGSIEDFEVRKSRYYSAGFFYRLWHGFLRLFWLERRYHKTEGLLFCGKTGSFKTYSAVEDALRWEAVVYHNLPKGSVKPLHDKQVIVHYEDFIDLVGIRCSVVILDECGLILNSQKYQSLPDDVREWFVHQRRFHNRLLMTTQRPMAVDTNARELAHHVVECIGHVYPFLVPRRFSRKSLKCRHCAGDIVQGLTIPFIRMGMLVVIERQFISWERYGQREKYLEAEKLLPLDVTNSVPKRWYHRRSFSVFSQKIADCYNSSADIESQGFKDSRKGKR